MPWRKETTGNVTKHTLVVGRFALWIEDADGLFGAKNGSWVGKIRTVGNSYLWDGTMPYSTADEAKRAVLLKLLSILTQNAHEAAQAVWEMNRSPQEE